MPTGQSDRKWMLPAAVSTVGALVALLFSLTIYPGIQTSLHANIDPDRFGELSRNIVDGKGYVYENNGHLEPSFDRGPVYPGVVAGLHFITGSVSFAPVQIFQSILHGLTCWIVYHLALRIYPRGPSLAAQMGCALHPMLVWYTARIWIETTHTFLVALSAYLLLGLMNHASLRKGTVTGIVFGLTSLTKSVLLPFFIIGGLYVAAQNRSRFEGLALVAACVLVVLPWTMRNYSISGMFVPVHTSLGLNMMQGDAIAEHWAETPFSSLAIWQKGNARKDSILGVEKLLASNPSGDRQLIRTSIENSLRRPFFAAKRFFLNVLTFCYLSESPLKSIILATLQFPLFALACAGARRGWRNHPEIRILALVVVYFIVIHGLVVGWARYSSPIVPLVMILAVGVARFPKTSSAPMSSLLSRLRRS